MNILHIRVSSVGYTVTLTKLIQSLLYLADILGNHMEGHSQILRLISLSAVHNDLGKQCSKSETL